jgi:hypothetical protein
MTGKAAVIDIKDGKGHIVMAMRDLEAPVRDGLKGGIEAKSAAQPGRAQTERRTETRSLWKHCTNAQQ